MPGPRTASGSTACRASSRPALPDLETAIGLPWPVDRELEVSEVSRPQIEGYAGFFYDSATTRSRSARTSTT